MTAAPRADPFAAALAEAARSLEDDPRLAERRSAAVLALDAAEPRARLVLGAARRRLGDLLGAKAVLEPLARTQPNSAPAHIELGLTLAALGDDVRAIPSLERAVALKPSAVEAWRALARSALRLGAMDAAESALRRCLEHSPSSSGATWDLAVLLHRRQEDGEAIALAERLVATTPRDEAYRGLLAACSAQVGDYVRAIELYRGLVEEHPAAPEPWLSLGHALRAIGDRAAAVDAYRRALAHSNAAGETFWSLVNLKAFRLRPDEEADLRARLESPDLAPDDRLQLHYALGRALEQRGDFADSFHHYAFGARLCRNVRPYDAPAALAAMSPTRHAFAEGVFQRDDAAEAAAPIFIVGLPRAGSTLVEQILASHSQVEGCGELPTLPAIARRLAARLGDAYPSGLTGLSREVLADCGARYLAETRVYRRHGRPRFVDKMPNNVHHLALIRLALPGARIIDARRSPMATGFSLFKQHFAAGHAFSYDLRDIGEHYRAYVALMAHYDAVMPGAVLRVDYERLVVDTEAEIRRLLDFCDLPFEPACLAFHDNDRAVRTASSEQVRQPIFTDGLDHWRHFEPWLAPLAEALARP
jgi:tetratricopeptide (TPR) repeat protein